MATTVVAAPRARRRSRIDAPQGFRHHRSAPSARLAIREWRRVSSTGPVLRLLAFVLRRILQSIAVMAVVAFIAFGLFNFTGDPVTFMVTQQATLEERAELRAALGLDR